MPGLSQIVIVIGAALLAIGLLMHFTNIGRLPGDIVVKRNNFTFYFPLMTSLLLSLGLTLILWLLRRK